jgi:DNA-binding transcriptional MocR family regulator
VSTLLQQLVVAIETDPGTAARLAAAAGAYRERRAALLDALAALGITARGRSGMNVWVPVGDEASVTAALAAAGIGVAPGSLFRIASPPAIRVTVSQLPPAEAPAVATAIATAVRPAARISR